MSEGLDVHEQASSGPLSTAPDFCLRGQSRACRGDARCVIETIEITYRRYSEVDAAFAYDEGKGDLSLVYWRNAHRTYFGRLGRFSEDMMLMCERFRLVEVFGD